MQIESYKEFDSQKSSQRVKVGWYEGLASTADTVGLKLKNTIFKGRKLLHEGAPGAFQYFDNQKLVIQEVWTGSLGYA